jgi:hypothetical protein
MQNSTRNGNGTVREVRNIRLGRALVNPSAASHIAGVSEGNERGHYEKMGGHLPGGRSTARRSTSINPDDENPLIPEMPNLSPA